MSSSSAPKTENKKGDFFARPWEPPSRGAPMGQSPHQVTTILTQGETFQMELFGETFTGVKAETKVKTIQLERTPID